MFAIIAELKYRKLLDRYSNSGIDASMFEPELYRVVFLLTGIKTERQYNYVKDWYDDQIERIIEIDIAENEKINDLAGEILIGLMEKRNQMRS